jgi:hypothetical protein
MKDSHAYEHEDNAAGLPCRQWDRREPVEDAGADTTKDDQ